MHHFGDVSPKFLIGVFGDALLKTLTLVIFELHPQSPKSLIFCSKQPHYVGYTSTY